MTYDLRDASFEEFLDFLFDHPVAAQHREENWGRVPGADMSYESAWFDDLGLYPWTQVSHDPNLTANFYIRLFEGPRVLLARYSRSQIAQGFALIPGFPNLEFPAGLGRLFVEERVPLGKRLSVVRALDPLHRDLLAPEGFDRTAWGLWGGMRMGFTSAIEIYTSDRDIGEEIRTLRQAMFEVLVDLMDHSDPDMAGLAICQLGYQDHPDTAPAIRACLAKRNDLSKQDVELAQRVIEFFESGRFNA